MKKSDVTNIRLLMAANFKVVIKDLKAKTFNERFDVYQAYRFDELKRVVLDDIGRPIALQG